MFRKLKTILVLIVSLQLAEVSPLWCMPAQLIAPNSWSLTSVGNNVPSPRSKHVAVTSGNELIVWGGVATNGKTNTGGRLNLTNNLWTPTTTTGAPTARSYHTAVSTNTGKMIVWGGDDAYAPYVNTGGVYDPTSDSWTATAVGAATPIGRDSHTAIWTGTKMIVWGGYKSYSGVQNTGGVYDPVNNSWVRTDNSYNVPAPRENHSAVWTGSEMIIWGGDNGGSVFNDGGIYNPVTGTWRKITTVNAPAARTYHTAVWTGSKMIVWGGAGFGALNSGGIYDPQSDSWQIGGTSLLNAPSKRSSHRAVWTGSKMIIWGTGGVQKDPGGIYDPSNDTWLLGGLATIGAPNARTFHTMNWSSFMNRMITWGGNDNIYGATNTGGIFTAP